MVEKHGTRIVETAIEARGAERGPTVRNLPVWSLGLVVAAMAIVWLVFSKLKLDPVVGRFRAVVAIRSAL
jgi:hypothetical protein